MRKFIAITRAIASAQRIRMLLALREQPLWVSVLTELLGLARNCLQASLDVGVGWPG